MKTVIKGAIAGGLALWLWSFVYWALSGIPLKGMAEFKDEVAVEKVLRENLQGPGYYTIPTAFTPEGADPADFEKMRMEKIAGDFFFAGAVRPGGLGGMGGQVGCALLGYILSAALATWLLMQTAGLAYGRRVLFVLALGVLGWFVGMYPAMVWWGNPGKFLGLQLLDVVVGWGGAGLVLAKLVGDADAATLEA